MNDLIKLLKMYSLKQKLILGYFLLSFCSLCLAASHPVVVVVVVVNFGVSVRLLRTLPLSQLP